MQDELLPRATIHRRPGPGERRHESAEDELQAQTSFLESLVDSIAVVSSPLEAKEIIERMASLGAYLLHTNHLTDRELDRVGRPRSEQAQALRDAPEEAVAAFQDASFAPRQKFQIRQDRQSF